MIYALDPDRRDEIVTRSTEAIDELDGVDLVMWLAGPDGDEVVVRSDAGELRFAPGGELEDERGERWSIEGDHAVLDLQTDSGRVTSEEYPDALARSWSALGCSNAGDVLLSAAPGYEFVDWGGADHVGGGSHGSLHRSDSLGALMWCGTGPETRAVRDRWSLLDVAPMVREHFGVQSGEG
jgi:hypothetical protein